MLMRESTTYQAILEEGEDRGRAKGVQIGLAEGQRTMLLRLGINRFGPPSPEVAAAMRNITDESRLEQLADRILDARNWEDLLDVHCSNG